MSTVTTPLSTTPTPEEMLDYTILKNAYYRADGMMIRFENGGWRLVRVEKFGLFPLGGPYATLEQAEEAGGGGFVMDFADYESETHGSSRVLRRTPDWIKIFAVRPMQSKSN